MAAARDAFDVLILGGGTAGCVLAARLSEEESRSVCLVEAGPDYGPYDDGGWPQEILDARAVPKTHDWGLEGDVSLLRARIIGGCSAHNACFVVWGARDDYDEWQANGGGWDFASLKPYLARAETELRTRELSSEELSAWHHAASEAAMALGFPRLNSLNDLDAGEGVAPIPLSAVGVVRWSTALAYLDAARGRYNLELVADARVDRVLLEGERAIGALVRTTGGEREFRARCVVVAAGAYGSPAILMRSGIGPPDHLRELGIEVTLSRSAVGANLVDHPGVNVFFQPNDRLATELRAQVERGLLFQGQCAIRARTATCPEGLWDLHLLPWTSQLGTWPGELPPGIIEGDFETHITVFAMKPASRGRVRLRSPDPAVLPLIEQHFLSDPGDHDLATILEGVERVRRLAATPALSQLIAHEAYPGGSISGRDQLARWVQEAVRGYFHPVGTCAMGPAGDVGAVVNGRGAVHGVENLYVVDASVMPTIPRANTNLTTVAIAERLAQAIPHSPEIDHSPRPSSSR
jgi:choline dehydrogenase